MLKSNHLERSQLGIAAVTVVGHTLQLGEDARATGHNTIDADQVVQVTLTEVAQTIGDGKVNDSDVNLLRNLCIYLSVHMQTNKASIRTFL